MPTDVLGRPLSNLRLSVTDRCNLRCAYCMPEEHYRWLPNPEILSFEELSTLVDRFMACGVRRVRLTGGEPLMRRALATLITLLARKSLDDLSMTTNGVLLAEHARELKAAGLQRLTISLDTLRADRFAKLTRRDQLSKVLAGIEAATRAGFTGTKLDTVVMRGVNDDELNDLLKFGREVNAEVRFIEYMDVGGATKWNKDTVVPAREVLSRLGPVKAVGERGSAPAERFMREDGQIFGVIASTTQPFCGSCDRARLTADGRWFTCLYATDGVDLKKALRSGASTEQLEALIASTWSGRRDRGAEDRLRLRDARGPLASKARLAEEPHLEMHTRGG
ncbi:MAG: GTP 3',8-cyclase MoaA [Archangium sp.]